MSETADSVSEHVRDPVGSIFLTKIGHYVRNRLVHIQTSPNIPPDDEELIRGFLTLKGDPTKKLLEIAAIAPDRMAAISSKLELSITLERGEIKPFGVATGLFWRWLETKRRTAHLDAIYAFRDGREL